MYPYSSFTPCLCKFIIWLVDTINYYLACICSQYNVRFDWLNLGHYSPVMPMG